MLGKVKSLEHSKRGLHVVAIFEATKGLLVLVTGFGLLSFLHKDLHMAAEQLVDVQPRQQQLLEGFPGHDRGVGVARLAYCHSLQLFDFDS